MLSPFKYLLPKMELNIVYYKQLVIKTFRVIYCFENMHFSITLEIVKGKAISYSLLFA